ncbi:MAG: AmmeMemoRadiSam system radical SAM enzyme [Actinobacteria bacterium]|nr:AmmeMemoRadiSam system radical SAM enzyme [Actinomycetota bacterium]
MRAPAVLWEPWRGGPAVHCFLCAHHCHIEPGERGRCLVRENREGKLETLVYGRAVAAAVDPIEKKPLFHFLPGSLSYSLAAVGCNFSCLFCQNSDISQMPHDKHTIEGIDLLPEEVVSRAVAGGCASLAYTYTEPTVFFEYAEACMNRAVEVGLKNVFVTNGYMTRQALARLDGLLHAANVDLKGFTDGYYRRVIGARLGPVKRSIALMLEMGTWVEVTTLLVPGLNDDSEELRSLAAFLASLSTDIPWHISRYYPSYRLLDVPPTPVSTIERACVIGKEAGLNYVYAGNIPGHACESTVCPKCGQEVISRTGFSIRRTNLNGNCCGTCGAELPLIGVEVQP